MDLTDESCRKEHEVYRKKFIFWKKDDLIRLKKIKEFNQASADENYIVYEIINQNIVN